MVLAGMFAVFHNVWDWTAIGTLALALVTAIALVIGWLTLRQTKREIALSRREVEEAHRPVLVPVLDRTRAITLEPGGTPNPAEPIVPGNRIFVPVENIGSGPALEVEMGLTLDGHNVPDGLKGHEGTMDAPGIGVGHLTTLELPMAGAVIAPFDLRLSYRDVAGKPWVTRARFEIGMASRYENLSIVATEDDS
jgi:hypothetical protein